MLVTQAEFSRMMNVSRKSVSVWKKHGRLVIVDDRVDVAASRARLEKLSLGTSKAFIGAKTLPAEGNGAPEVNNDECAALPGPAGFMIDAAECWGADVAMLLFGQVSDDFIESLCEELVKRWRLDVAEQIDRDLGPPAGFLSWADHQRVNRPVGLDLPRLKAAMAGA